MLATEDGHVSVHRDLLLLAAHGLELGEELTKAARIVNDMEADVASYRFQIDREIRRFQATLQSCVWAAAVNLAVLTAIGF